MYCVYCGEDHDPTTDFTDEHIVPYALGGSDELTIQVCRSSNNSLGGLVDKPFIEIFPVRAQRFFLGLRGTDGTEPTIDLGGKSLVNGKEVDVKYTITKDGKELRIAKPTVAKTPGDGWDYWSVAGDPKQVREIIEGKLKSLNTRRKQARSESGEVLTLENLGAFLASAPVNEVRSIVKKIEIDPLACFQCLAKMALSTGHFVLGESFSRSAGADMLRKAVYAKDLQAARIPCSFVWPYTDGKEQLFAPFQIKHSHVLGVLYGEPTIFIASLFGEYDAFIPLAPYETGKAPKISDQGRIFQIDLPSRRLHDRTLPDYLAAFLSHKLLVKPIEKLRT
jgi:hypothetical protein